MAVRVDLNISLDGFATTTDQTPEDPMGQDGGVSSLPNRDPHVPGPRAARHDR